MEMRVVVQWLAPGVEHGEAAAVRPEMLRVPGNVLERLRHGAKEQAIEMAGVLQRQRPEVVRQGQDHMTGGGLEEFVLSGGEPRGLRGALTCGAAAVPARVVCLHFVPTVVALGNVVSGLVQACICHAWHMSLSRTYSRLEAATPLCDPVYLQPEIFQLSSVSRIFQQYEV
jgi:hypothetical protein